jgi:hypothetical protein
LGHSSHNLTAPVSIRSLLLISRHTHFPIPLSCRQLSTLLCPQPFSC